MADFKKDENELGVLWEKESARGTYYTGSIEINGEKIAIVAFRNGNKTSNKAPDWRILRSRPREDNRQHENEVGYITTPSDEGVPF